MIIRIALVTMKILVIVLNKMDKYKYFYVYPALYVYEYMYICTYVYVYVCMYIFVYVGRYMLYVNLCAYLYMYMYAHTHKDGPLDP